MKLKRTIGLVLAAVMTVSGLNFSYANEPPNETTELTDILMENEHSFNNSYENEPGSDVDILTDENVVSESAIDAESGIDISNSELQSNGIAVPISEPIVEFAGGDGTEENPYQIATAEQLEMIHNNLSAHYILVSDIDLSGVSWKPIGQNTPTGSTVPPFKDNNNFEPYEEPFAGSLDGNNYTIKNVSINGDDIYDIGLFGYTTSKSYIKNLKIEGLNISVDKINTDFVEQWNNNAVYSVVVGGIAGFSKGTIENCTVSGTINVININDGFIGGICGRGTAKQCVNRADIKVISNKSSRYENDGTVCVGGITGHTDTTYGNITDCINYGGVNAEAGDFLYCGGISGEYGSIDKCINYGENVGNVTNPHSYSSFAYNCNSGGIVGATSAIVKNSVNLGKISSSVKKNSYYNASAAGGIAGYNGYYNSGKILNCYNGATSVVSIENTLKNEIKYINGGRICGYNAATINDCFSYYKTRVNHSIPSTDIGTDKKNGENIMPDELNTNLYDLFGIEFNEPDSEIIGANGTKLSIVSKQYDVGTITDNTNYLTASVTPHLDDKSGITWESSNTNVVEIVDNGYIDGITSDMLYCNLNCKSVGTSIISVTSADGASASCLVTVKEKKLTIEDINVNNLGNKVSYDGLTNGDIDIQIKFNSDVNINVEKTATLYSYVNENKVVVGESSLENTDKPDTIKINYIGRIPSGKIYIDFSDGAIEPAEENISYSIEEINGNYFENTANFVYGLDSFSFKNNKENFETNYTFSKSLIDLLKKSGIKQNCINSYNNKEFKGSCYGMASYLAMSKRNSIDISKYTDEVYNKYFNIGTKYPKNDTQEGGVKDTLYYLQMMQYTKGLGNQTKVGLWGNENNIADTLKEIIQLFENNSDSFNIVLNIAYKDNSTGNLLEKWKTHEHAITPYKVNSNADGYEIYCYDPNETSSPTIIRCDKNFKNIDFISESETVHYDKVKGVGYDKVSDIENLFNANYKTVYNFTPLSVDNSVFVSLVLDVDTEITDGTHTIYYKNGEFSGDLDIITDSKIYGGGEPDSAAELELELPKGNYTVKSEGGSLNCTYDNGEMFANIETSGAAEVSFDENKKIDIVGDGIESSALLSFDGSGENSVIVDIPNTDNVKITADDSDNLSVNTSDTIELNITKLTDCEITDKESVNSNSTIDFSDTIIKSKEKSGDIDGDGQITSTDANLALFKSAGIRDLSETQFVAADVDYDGKITSTDANFILFASAGLRELE